MSRLKLNLLFPLICLLIISSCSNQVNDSEIEMKVTGIEMYLFEYQTINEADTIKWYYVDEIIFNFSVENKTKDTLVFGAFNRRISNAKWGKYKIIYQNNESELRTNNQATRIIPNDSTLLLIAAKSTDIECLSRIYSRRKFKEKFIDFIKNAVFVYNPIQNDYKSEFGTEFNVYNYCKTDTKFKINDENFTMSIFLSDKPNRNLTIDSIGYPYDVIPENLKVNRQIDEFDY